jgi:sugar phosphate isomerase/epimerase
MRRCTHRSLALIIASAIAMSAHLSAHAADTPHREHLGLQLYSLRAQFKADPLAALDLVKGWGITEVETWGGTGLAPAELRAALEARGLKPVAAHVGYESLEKDVAAAIAEVKAVGADLAFVPWIPHQDGFDASEAHKAARDFEKWGAAFRAAGIRFGYHIHGYEFSAGSKPGQTLFDEMVAMTTSENVSYEFDVFWAVHGGADPVALLKTYPGRWVALHIKDMRRGAETGLTTGHAPVEDQVVVGSGQIDMPAFLRAAREVGVTYYIIEDETTDPVANIPASAKYLRDLKL